MKRVVLLSLLALVLAVTVLATPSEAVFFCHKNFYCLDVWDPVICDNGVVYSNDCYAARACATGCVPYGAY